MKKLIATFIAGLALAAQAGEVKWGSGDNLEVPSTDIVTDASQGAVPETASRVSGISGMMAAVYHATFAPYVNSVLANAQSATLSSSESSVDESAGEPSVATTPRAPFASNVVGYQHGKSIEDLEEEEGWAVMPEPSTALLALAGAMAILLRRRRA